MNEIVLNDALDTPIYRGVGFGPYGVIIVF
jgi:hypothetical protein